MHLAFHRWVCETPSVFFSNPISGTPPGGGGGGSLQAAFKFVPPQSEALRFQAEPHRESLRACNLRATSDFMEKRTCRIIGT